MSPVRTGYLLVQQLDLLGSPRIGSHDHSTHPSRNATDPSLPASAASCHEFLGIENQEEWRRCSVLGRPGVGAALIVRLKPGVQQMWRVGHGEQTISLKGNRQANIGLAAKFGQSAISSEPRFWALTQWTVWPRAGKQG